MDSTSKFLLRVRVCFSSPRDVKDEREVFQEVIANLSAVVAPSKGIHLERVMSEDARPSRGPAQPSLMKQFGNIDLLIALFWGRVGTPTGGYPSGTLQEIDEAYKKNIPIWVYRKMDDLPTTEDLTQAPEVQNLFKTWRSSDKFLDKPYRGDSGHFKKMLQNDLEKWVLEGANVDPIQCIIDFRTKEGLPKQKETVENPSDLHYLVVERVKNCEETRKRIRRVLERMKAKDKVRFLPSDSSFKITGLYDTMGRHDVLVRFRASQLMNKNEFMKYLFTNIKPYLLSPRSKSQLSLIDVEKEASSLEGIVDGSANGKIDRTWLTSTRTYMEQKCQRYFLVVDLPKVNRASLIKKLAKAIEGRECRHIIESVSYPGSKGRFLVFEIFLRCMQSNLIQELNQTVELFLPRFGVGKSTLSCFEYNEIVRKEDLLV